MIITKTSEILKALRTSKGLSAPQLCAELKIGSTTYQNYETKDRIPAPEILIKLADFYGVTTDYLLGREPQKETPLRTFAKGANLKQLEEILIKEYLELDDKQREAVLDFLRRCIEKEERRKRGEPVDDLPIFGDKAEVVADLKKTMEQGESLFGKSPSTTDKK